LLSYQAPDAIAKTASTAPARTRIHSSFTPAPQGIVRN